MGPVSGWMDIELLYSQWTQPLWHIWGQNHIQSHFISQKEIDISSPLRTRMQTTTINWKIFRRGRETMELNFAECHCGLCGLVHDYDYYYWERTRSLSHSHRIGSNENFYEFFHSVMYTKTKPKCPVNHALTHERLNVAVLNTLSTIRGPQWIFDIIGIAKSPLVYWAHVVFLFLFMHE